MARKQTQTPNAAASTDAAKKGEENLNPDDSEEDEDENLNPNPDADENDDADDSDEDDSDDEDELAQQDKDFEEQHGYPPRTPAKDMTVEQRALYFEENSKKWEKRAKAATKAFEGLTPEELTRLRGVETAHTELLAKKTDDTDTAKAIEDAKSSVRNKLVPLLVATKLEALTSGRIEEERLQKHLSRLRLDDFVNEDGEFDSDALKEFAEDFFPAAPASTRRTGTDHLGHRDHSGAPPVSDSELGRQRALARLGKK